MELDVSADPESQFREIKQALQDTQPIGSLLQVSDNWDQGKILIKMIETLAEKQGLNTISLLGPKSSGKSYALGLAIAGAVSFNYSNIFVTSSSIDELKNLFKGAIDGLKLLGYVQEDDFQVVTTLSNQERVTKQINVWRTCRQFIQYIDPYETVNDSLLQSCAQLVIIDEAASLPLEIVKKLFGPYLVFFSCTNAGLKASGRLHIERLLKHLRLETNKLRAQSDKKLCEMTLSSVITGREDEPNQWSEDHLRFLNWKNKDFTELTACPPPDDCSLFYVDKQKLFQSSRSSESFLRKIVALFHSNSTQATPELLGNFSSPDHHIFCLVPPKLQNQEKVSKVPEVLCLILMRLEYQDEDSTSRAQNSKVLGIPDFLVEYFDEKLTSLKGAEILKISTHPSYEEKEYGYGRKAIQILENYLKGHYNVDLGISTNCSDIPKSAFFIELSNKKVKKLNYVVVHTDLSNETIKFWKKTGYIPAHVCSISDPISRVHQCLMIKAFSDEESGVKNNEWIISLWQQFRSRFISLLSSHFRHLKGVLAVEVLIENDYISTNRIIDVLSRQELEIFFTLHDLKRLRVYSQYRDDYRRITDMLPTLARFFFTKKFGEDFHLSPAQMIILLGTGLQGKSIDEVGDELGLPGNQILAHFLKAIKKISSWLDGIEEKAIGQSLGLDKQQYDRIYSMKPVEGALDDELEDAAKEVVKAEHQSLKLLTQEMKQLAKYAIKGSEDQWDSILKAPHKSIVTIKSLQSKKSKPELDKLDAPDKRRKKFHRQKAASHKN